MSGIGGNSSVSPTKSLQYGTVSWDNTAALSGTATVTSVDTTKAVLGNLGWTDSTGLAANVNQNSKLALTNATTVTGSSGAIVGSSGTHVVGFVLWETN